MTTTDALALADTLAIQDLVARYCHAVADRDFATSRAEFERSIALQRAYLLEEPAAGLARRDLLWTTFASAQSLKAAGDAAGQRLRLRNLRAGSILLLRGSQDEPQAP